MGDLFTNRRLDAGRAVWTRPLPGEKDVPKKRIIHQRVVRLHGPARLHRLGGEARAGLPQVRQPAGPRLGHRPARAGLRGGRWRVLLQRDGLKAGIPGVVDWFKLPRVVTNGVIIELRRSGIDGGWTAWNLAMSAFILEGEMLASGRPAPGAPAHGRSGQSRRSAARVSAPPGGTARCVTARRILRSAFRSGGRASPISACTSRMPRMPARTCWRRARRCSTRGRSCIRSARRRCWRRRCGATWRARSRCAAER